MTGLSIRWVCIAAALVTAVSACGTAAEDESVPATDDVARPTASAPASLGPITEQPRDTRVVDGPSFSMFAPAEYQQSTREGPRDIPMIVLSKPADEPGGVIEVVAFDEQDPPSTAQEQMALLAAAKSELEGVTGFRRETIEWPGATDGVVVQWTEKTNTAQGQITQRFAQLSLQVSAAQITTVLAVAPEDEFESSGVLDLLRTMTLDSA